MNTYRLAFALVKYFPFGGMQRNLLRIAGACADRGHEVHVFASEWSGPRPPDLRVRLLRTRALSNHGRNERFGRALGGEVNATGFDCVVGSNRQPHLDVYYAGDPCWAARVRERRPAWFRYMPHYREYLRQEAHVFERGRDTEILLPAHAEREKFIRHYGTDPDRFHLLPPGIDCRRLTRGGLDAGQRDRLRAGLGIGPEDFMLLSVGSSFRTKGVDRSIRGLGALPADLRRRCRLVVVGAGRPGSLRYLARRSDVPDRVLFVGPREDPAAFYHAADLLLHPARQENTGNALIEAMVCGLPVLTTANCGYAFHVERAGAGTVCPSPFDQETYGRLLRCMLTSEGRKQWRDNALAYCRRADLYSLVDRAADAILARAERNRRERDGFADVRERVESGAE